MNKRDSGEHTIGFLQEAETGVPTKEVCRRNGFSKTSELGSPKGTGYQALFLD